MNQMNVTGATVLLSSVMDKVVLKTDVVTDFQTIPPCPEGILDLLFWAPQGTGIEFVRRCFNVEPVVITD